MIKTTFRLCFEIDPDHFQGQDTKDDLINIFKATPVRVQERSAPEAPYPDDSVIRLHATLLHRPVWLHSQDQADERWDDVLYPQVSRILPDIQRDLKRCATHAIWRKTATDEITFNRFDLLCDPYLISVQNPERNTIGPVMDVARRLRGFLNDGTLDPATVKRVDAPFIDVDALWDAYEAAHGVDVRDGRGNDADDADDTDDAGASAVDADAGADAEAGGNSDTAAGDEETAHTVSDDEPEKCGGGDQARADAGTGNDAPTSDGTQTPDVTAPQVDYRIWGITFDDGTVQFFDSETGAFCEKPEPEPQAV